LLAVSAISAACSAVPALSRVRSKALEFKVLTGAVVMSGEGTMKACGAAALMGRRGEVRSLDGVSVDLRWEIGGAGEIVKANVLCAIPAFGTRIEDVAERMGSALYTELVARFPLTGRNPEIIKYILGFVTSQLKAQFAELPQAAARELPPESRDGLPKEAAFKQEQAVRLKFLQDLQRRVRAPTFKAFGKVLRPEKPVAESTLCNIFGGHGSVSDVIFDLAKQLEARENVRARIAFEKAANPARTDKRFDRRGQKSRSGSAPACKPGMFALTGALLRPFDHFGPEWCQTIVKKLLRAMAKEYASRHGGRAPPFWVRIGFYFTPIARANGWRHPAYAFLDDQTKILVDEHEALHNERPGEWELNVIARQIIKAEVFKDKGLIKDLPEFKTKLLALAGIEVGQKDIFALLSMAQFIQNKAHAIGVLEMVRSDLDDDDLGARRVLNEAIARLIIEVHQGMNIPYRPVCSDPLAVHFYIQEAALQLIPYLKLGGEKIRFESALVKAIQDGGNDSKTYQQLAFELAAFILADPGRLCSAIGIMYNIHRNQDHKRLMALMGIAVVIAAYFNPGFMVRGLWNSPQVNQFAWNDHERSLNRLVGFFRDEENAIKFAEILEAEIKDGGEPWFIDFNMAILDALAAIDYQNPSIVKELAERLARMRDDPDVSPVVKERIDEVLRVLARPGDGKASVYRQLYRKAVEDFGVYTANINVSAVRIVTAFESLKDNSFDG
ncbi:MAG: hypothetical protein HQL18_03570, partial [Candidatus Omnitrophica bacterium]|nr:hypothetical protein [Candidatus Omnitrophota bacterium]